MSTSSDRLKSLKALGENLYSSTQVPNAEDEPDSALSDVTGIPKEASCLGWPVADVNPFNDLGTTKILYCDPLAQEKILKARSRGRLVLEIRPFSRKKRAIRLLTPDGYRFTAAGLRNLRELGFLLIDGRRAQRLCEENDLVELASLAVEVAEHDLEDRAQELAKSMTAQALYRNLDPQVEWLSPFEENLPGRPPSGLDSVYPGDLELSSEREVPVIEAFLKQLAHPQWGRGANLMALPVSLPSGLRERSRIQNFNEPLRESTLVDFVRKNSKSWRHQLEESRTYPLEPLPFPHATLRGPWNDWEAFHRRWPGFDGVGWISRVGFSQFDQQAFLHALIITDQRLAGWDNAGKSTFSSGLQVLLERSRTGEWEVLDWDLDGSPIQNRPKSRPSLEEGLRSLPGFQPSDGETSDSLLSEKEAVVGTCLADGQRVLLTTVGLRVEGRLYEYPDLVLRRSGNSRRLGCLYDALDLNLGLTPKEYDSILYDVSLTPHVIDGDSPGWQERLRYRKRKPLPRLEWEQKTRRASMGLDTAELVIELERRFHLDIPDQEILRIETVGELHRWLCTVLNSSDWTEEAVWTELREVVLHHFDVEPEKVSEETSFIRDLGAS